MASVSDTVPSPIGSLSVLVTNSASRSRGQSELSASGKRRTSYLFDVLDIGLNRYDLPTLDPFEHALGAPARFRQVADAKPSFQTCVFERESYVGAQVVDHRVIDGFCVSCMPVTFLRFAGLPGSTPVRDSPLQWRSHNQRMVLNTLCMGGDCAGFF